MDIKRKTCDIRIRKKAFISRHILHQHRYTCPIALQVHRNAQHRSFWLLPQPLSRSNQNVPTILTNVRLMYCLHATVQVCVLQTVRQILVFASCVWLPTADTNCYYQADDLCAATIDSVGIRQLLTETLSPTEMEHEWRSIMLFLGRTKGWSCNGFSYSAVSTIILTAGKSGEIRLYNMKALSTTKRFY
jgi:hypothetical protein